MHIGVRNLSRNSRSRQVLRVLVLRANAFARCAAEVVLGVAGHGWTVLLGG